MDPDLAADQTASLLAPLLSLKNGFYAFENALHVLSVGNQDEKGLIEWNAKTLWRVDYKGMANDASRSDLEELCRILAAHAVHPVIDRVFSLEEAKAAWAHFADRRLFGKVVIRHSAS
ncbi:MAG: zinc-binding dehydrogenase family protein [bacterium]|nr:zinc-binding dehydrogenase family protein [bacterium]